MEFSTNSMLFVDLDNSYYGLISMKNCINIEATVVVFFIRFMRITRKSYDFGFHRFIRQYLRKR